jgi:hypothetical protein
MWHDIKEWAIDTLLVLAILVLLGIGGVLVTGFFLVMCVTFLGMAAWQAFSSLFLSTEGREKGEEEGGWR